MASRKDLKKDIDYFVFDLVSDCYERMDENPDQDFSGYEQIINDIIDLQDNLLARINQYDSGKDSKSRKYFKEIKNDLAEGLKKGYEALESLSK
jgi:hypothetical protein